ncbi:L,D-transpeptidase family protein [Peristeroidobacter agariperforans]|uniref:L,D-transpeptidase family protein n=1 Tax=Peristeroidobacter agariperforans TaxID=268404 RepID=UPI0018E59416|nr:L,D-transpeptidase family protein [Peristeroidobacter agariperforans]
MTRAILLGMAVVGAWWAVVTHAAEPLLWVKQGRPSPQAEDIEDALREAERHGLRADAYLSGLTSTELQRVHGSRADAELLNRYDTDLSGRVSRFVAHLRYGRVNASAAGFDLPATKERTDIPTVVRRLANSRSIEAEIDSIEPRAVPYRLLKEALARYRQLAKDQVYSALPAPSARSAELGDEYSGAMRLRQQLLLLGDLPATTGASTSSATLDAPVVDGLKRFQSRHGLSPDGVLGKQTLTALNVPLRQRARQIELSMERWRWLSELPRPEIVINIPQFMLYALPRPGRPGEQLLEIPVIVGQTKQRTPIFTASIEEVIFNPYWDVPVSIVRDELLPKIREDVKYLERHHFEIVRGGNEVQQPTPEAIAALAAGKFRLRQRPGADNALGPVKFVLPNPYSIRLHGTPEPDLFALSQRAFSHGCIRISDPAALAEYVLVNAPGTWDADAVETALCGTAPRRIKLKTPVRVIVFYATAAATVSRGVMFAPDLYGHDARLEKLLASAPAS